MEKEPTLHEQDIAELHKAVEATGDSPTQSFKELHELAQDVKPSPVMLRKEPTKDILEPSMSTTPSQELPRDPEAKIKDLHTLEEMLRGARTSEEMSALNNAIEVLRKEVE